MCPEIVDVAILLVRIPQEGSPLVNIKVSYKYKTNIQQASYN